MGNMKFRILGFLLVTSFLICLGAVWAGDEQLLSLENKYIKIFINNTDQETGRFAVDVTGGDPGRIDDNGKPLIYGHPKPWTSFSTIQIGGKNYVFGKSTIKRPGAGLPGGEIIELPKINNDQITMKCKYDTVEVEQLLDITRSPSTGALDTARIKYIFKNTGVSPVAVGLRTILDTMVGDNDGAPFRIGGKEVLTDYSCASTEYPDFWQAFDSLSKPAVIAQGTLKGGDVTTPDKLLFTNWGKAADYPWEIPIEAGQDFTRLGEYELDSAVAMYWYPRSIQPGGLVHVTIYYGLGGITFSPGTTFLGISAPAEIQYSFNASRKYTIVMYMEHRGEAKAENVKINLKLPTGLECVNGDSNITLPELMPGVTKQFLWEIRPNGLYQGETGFEVKVSGEHLEANEVSRKIKIVGPPVLNVSVSVPVIKISANHWEPYPAEIIAKVTNTGQSSAYNLKATFICEAGVNLAEGERSDKYLINLDNQAETIVSWQVVPTGALETGRFKVVITGDGLKPVTIPGELIIPPLSTKLSFVAPEVDKLRVGQIFNLDLFAYNLQDVIKFTADVKYDSGKLRLVYISRGTFLIEGDDFSEWKSGEIDNKNGIARNINGSRRKAYSGNEVTFIRLNFIVTAAGASEVTLENIKLLDANGNEVNCGYTPLKLQIEEAK